MADRFSTFIVLLGPIYGHVLRQNSYDNKCLYLSMRCFQDVDVVLVCNRLGEICVRMSSAQ